MKKMITSLSSFTLPLTFGVGFINSNTYSENISYLQTEENEDDKLTINQDVIYLISQLDSQKLNEVLKIIKAKQEENINEKDEVDLMAKLEEMALAMIDTIKSSLSMMIDEIGPFVMYRTKAFLNKSLETAAITALYKTLNFSKNRIGKILLKVSVF